jgi:hypothetical protein
MLILFQQRANELEIDYNPTASELDSRFNMTKAARAKAQELKDRADRLAGETTNKLDKLRSKKVLEFYIRVKGELKQLQNRYKGMETLNSCSYFTDKS